MAEEQWGLITRRQAHELGIPETTWERLIGSGRELRRVGYGVYQLVGAPEPDHLELRAAGCSSRRGYPPGNGNPMMASSRIDQLRRCTVSAIFPLTSMTSRLADGVSRDIRTSGSTPGGSLTASGSVSEDCP